MEPGSSDLIPLAQPVLGSEETAAVAETIASGWVAQGPRVAEFESALRERVGAAHAIALSSGTAALHLALMALDLGPGDEVVVPSLAFVATANAVRYVGARPVFADVDADTLSLTAATISEVLTPAAMAVVLVHHAGVPADIEEVRELCEPRGIAVVEGAASALGSSYRGRPIGGHSDLVAFSFQAGQVITTGEGGAITTSSGEWAERVRALREHGLTSTPDDRRGGYPRLEQYVETGFNYRMTDIQAAIGLVQLGRLDGLVERRRELAALYRSRLAAIPDLGLAGDPPYGMTNFQSFWVVLPEAFPLSRDQLIERLVERGVSARRGIMAAHLEPAYRGHAHVPLRVTERLAAHSLLLPLFDGLTASQIDLVTSVVEEAAQDTA